MISDLKTYIDTKFTKIPTIVALAMSKQTYSIRKRIGGFELPAGCLMVGAAGSGLESGGAYKKIYKINANNEAIQISTINITPHYLIHTFQAMANSSSDMKSYIDAKANRLKPLIEDVALGAAIRIEATPAATFERAKYFVTRFEVERETSRRWCHLRPLMYKLQGENVWRI